MKEVPQMSDSTTSSPQAESGMLGAGGAATTSGAAATAGGVAAAVAGATGAVGRRVGIGQNYARHPPLAGRVALPSPPHLRLRAMTTSLKSLLLGAALLLPASLVAAQQAPPATTLAQTLSANRFKKRILLVGTPAADAPELAQQRKLLAPAGPQLRERDVLVLQLVYSQLLPADRQYWTQELKQSLTGFSVVLIGKDGGVKLNQLQPLTPADLFGTVDKMPMRKQEVKRLKK